MAQAAALPKQTEDSCAVRQQGFTRDDTKAVKGIALVLMLFHHLAAFPDRFPVGFEGFKPLLAPSRSGGGGVLGALR